MRWSEIAPNLSVWTMSGARMKNGKPHDVHLSRPAQAVLRALSDARSKDRRGGEGEVCDFVFSTTGRRGHWTHGPNTCSPAIPESVSDRWTTQCWSSSARVGGPSEPSLKYLMRLRWLLAPCSRAVVGCGRVRYWG